MQTDASAAIGVAKRTGIGKLRHMHVCFLWLQELVKAGRIIIRKIFGEDNTADVYTKHITARDMDRKLFNTRWANVEYFDTQCKVLGCIKRVTSPASIFQARTFIPQLSRSKMQGHTKSLRVVRRVEEEVDISEVGSQEQPPLDPALRDGRSRSPRRSSRALDIPLSGFKSKG